MITKTITNPQTLPKSKSYVYFNNDATFKVFFMTKRPGPVRRFFYRLLLGWKWENV